MKKVILKMKIYILIVLGVIILFQDIIAGEPVVLEYSDSLIGQQDSLTQVRKLIGNVRLRQGDVRLTCSQAIQYLNTNRYDLIGNVVITQNTLTLKAPLIKYDGNTYIADASKGVSILDKETKLTAEQGTYSTRTLIAEFEKDVIVEDDSVIIYSDFIKHNRNNRVSNAWGNVLIDAKYSNALLIGDSVVNIPQASYSVVFGSPKLLQADSSITISKDSTKTNGDKIRVDTLTIAANKMESFRDYQNERYYATGDVEIIRDNLLSKSGKAVYFKDKDMLFLEEAPVVWYDSTQLQADSITVHIENKKLRLLEAKSSAFSISSADTINAVRNDQLSGNQIDIIFENDSLKLINSYGDAKSLYFISTDEKPDGLLSVGADKITIQMSDGKAENIIMTEKVPGEYAPEQIIHGREKEYYLPGYKKDYTKPKPIDLMLFKSRKR